MLTRPVHMVIGRGRTIPRRPLEHLPGICRPYPRLLDGLGAGGCRSPMTGRTSSSVPPSPSNSAVSRRPAGSSPPSRHRYRRSPGSGRTWDYRYCWLRDAYFVVKALNRIGATRTMEDFISFILSIVAGRPTKFAGLQRGADRADGRADRDAIQGLSTATGLCASAMPPPNRTSTNLWQRHPGGDADVL